METQQCTRCSRVLALAPENFHRNKTKKSGFAFWCKRCMAENFQAKKDHYGATNRRAYHERMKNDPEGERAKRAQWRDNNRESYREMIAECKRRHRQRYLRKGIEYQAKRVALMKSTGDQYTRNDILSIKADQSDLCFWCGCDLDDDFHTDHLVPLSKGGPDGLDNIVVACPPCNLRKGTKMPEAFAKEVGRVFP